MEILPFNERRFLTLFKNTDMQTERWTCRRFNKIQGLLWQQPHTWRHGHSPIVHCFFPRCLANGFQSPLFRCSLNHYWWRLTKHMDFTFVCVCVKEEATRAGKFCHLFLLPISVSMRCMHLRRKFTRHLLIPWVGCHGNYINSSGTS